jgi:hypothetical protein
MHLDGSGWIVANVTNLASMKVLSSLYIVLQDICWYPLYISSYYPQITLSMLKIINLFGYFVQEGSLRRDQKVTDNQITYNSCSWKRKMLSHQQLLSYLISVDLRNGCLWTGFMKWCLRNMATCGTTTGCGNIWHQKTGPRAKLMVDRGTGSLCC